MLCPLARALLHVVVAAQPCLCLLLDDSTLSLLQRDSSVTTRHQLSKAKPEREVAQPSELSAASARAASDLNRSASVVHFNESSEIAARIATVGEEVRVGTTGASNGGWMEPHFLQNTDAEAVAILKAHTRKYIDSVTVGLVAGVGIITSLGACMGKQYWVPAMVVGSYSVLIPGLFVKDFSFQIAVLLRDYAATIPMVRTADAFGIFKLDSLPKRLIVTRASDSDGEPGPIRESTRGMSLYLWNTGSKSGGVMIAIFAFVVPVMKLVFLGVGALWYRHPEASRVRAARAMIVIVQLISKWASPDMFAFALLYYLFHKLNHPPMIESLQILDVGFVCYSIFCVASVVSTLFLEVPEVPKDAQELAAEAEAHEASATLLQRFGGRMGLILVTVVNATAWAILFFHGLSQPVLSLRLETQKLIEEADFPRSLVNLAGKFLNLEAIEDMVRDDVSIWRAATSFWDWFGKSGELTLLLAFMLLGVLCIAFTVIDMALILLGACLAGGEERRASQILKAAKYIKHLAMLDVCLVGVLVISYAADVYKSSGVFISMQYGVWILAGAEVIHYLTFYTVCWAVQVLERDEKVPKTEGH